MPTSKPFVRGKTSADDMVVTESIHRLLILMDGWRITFNDGMSFETDSGKGELVEFVTDEIKKSYIAGRKQGLKEALESLPTDTHSNEADRGNDIAGANDDGYNRALTKCRTAIERLMK